MSKIGYWLNMYAERFGDSPNMLSLGDEGDAIEAIKKALEKGKPIPEDHTKGIDV
jgi:hypothetical protein